MEKSHFKHSACIFISVHYYILSYFIIMETTPLIDFAESQDEEKQWINDYCNDGEYNL